MAITTQVMADRMNVTWVTLARIERDGACVSMGNYAMALYILGKVAALEMLIDRTNDPLGLDLMDKRLPQRVWLKISRT